MFFRKLLLNPNILYISTRYGTYFVQLINSLLIAAYMGPLYLGIWGAINLVIQYATQLNMGIPHAAGTILSINKHHTKYIKKVIGGCIILLFGVNIVISIALLLSGLIRPDFFQKYTLDKYILYIIIIAVGLNFSALMSNVFRVQNKLLEIACSQSIFPFITLFLLLFFRGSELLDKLVYAYAITTIISLLLFVVRFPIGISWSMSGKLLKSIQLKGWNLFIYNSSFYLIMITSRTFLSIFYTVEEFGLFTFSFSIANIFVLILEAFSFLIWPKILNRLSRQDNNEAYITIQNIRAIYITVNNLLIYVGIAIIPFVLNYFDQYSATANVFISICIAQLIYSASYGFQGLLIAKGKENVVARISFLVLVINVFACGLFVYFKTPYSLFVLATAISYFFYVQMLSNKGLLLLGKPHSFLFSIRNSYPPSSYIPIAICLGGVILSVDFYWYIIPLFIFVLLNFKNFEKIFYYINEIITNKDVFKI